MTYGTTRSGLRGAAAALAFAFALAPFAARAQGPAGDFERGKRLIAEGIDLLNAYVSETARADKQYPLPADSNEETRKPVFEKVEAARAPLKERMRAAAERLEALAGSVQGGPLPEQARELADTLRVYGSVPGGRSAEVFREAEVTTKAILTYFPGPGFTDEARRNKVYGVVRLRAVLAADGRVKNILVIKGLPDGLTQAAVEAARGIRFKPASIDGRPVSQFVVLEYNFN